MNSINIIGVILLISLFSSGNNQPNEEWNKIQCNTDLKLRKLEYNWTISRFSSHEIATNHVIESPIFSDGTDDKYKWRLSLTTHKTNQSELLSLHLYLRIESKVEKVLGICNASILDKKRNVLWAKEKEVTEFNKTHGMGWSEFCKKDEFFRNQLLQNDTLIISIKLKLYDPDTITNIVVHGNKPKTTSPSLNIIDCDLAKNLASLLENPDHTDVVLSVNGTKYPAHKAILAARSKVFATFFKHSDWKNDEGKSQINITDLDEKTTGEMLKYIYTGKCENLKKLAKDLFLAAEKYGLDRLKMICLQNLYNTLSIENAADILVFADTRHLGELKFKAIEFIVDNSAQILDTDAWKSIVLSKPSLVNEVCRRLSNKLKKNCI